jgi:hypothetical protein
MTMATQEMEPEAHDFQMDDWSRLMSELAITVLGTINDPGNKFAIDSPAVER